MRVVNSIKTFGEWIFGAVMFVVLLIMLFFALFPFASDSAKEDTAKYEMLPEPRSFDAKLVILPAHNIEITEAHIVVTHSATPMTGTTAMVVAAEGFQMFIS